MNIEITYMNMIYWDKMKSDSLLKLSQMNLTWDSNQVKSQEMDSMMSMMHSQINRAITTAIAERVIPEIQNIANSMSSTGHRDT